MFSSPTLKLGCILFFSTQTCLTFRFRQKKRNFRATTRSHGITSGHSTRFSSGFTTQQSSLWKVRGYHIFRGFHLRLNTVTQGVLPLLISISLLCSVVALGDGFTGRVHRDWSLSTFSMSWKTDFRKAAIRWTLAARCSLMGS